LKRLPSEKTENSQQVIDRCEVRKFSSHGQKPGEELLMQAKGQIKRETMPARRSRTYWNHRAGEVAASAISRSKIGGDLRRAEADQAVKSG
jgi:hypothetical protein